MSDSAVLGTYRAVVVNNNDPASGARVTLRVPQVLGDAESNWAVPAVPTSIIPAPGDLLWVSFEGGDVTSPVYTPPGLQQLTEAIDGLDGTQFTGSPPKPPSALTLSTAQNVSPEGVAAGVVVAEWVAPTENQDGSVPVKKLVGYRAQYSYDQITWSGGAFTSDTSWLFDGLRCGVTVYVRVQSLSNVSGPGTWEVDQIDTAPATGPSLDDLQTAIGNTDTKAQTALESANGKNKVTFSTDPPGSAAGIDGDTWFQINGSENVVGQWRCAGGDPVLWEPAQLSHEVIASLDAAKITVGLLRGDQMETGSITAEHLASVIAIINKLCSSETGRRWEADDDGIRLYDVDESLIVNLSTDPKVPASISGDLVATSLTVTDQLAIRGLVNEISKGAQIKLSSGTTAPSSPASVVVEWDSVSTKRDPTYDPYRVGMAWDTTKGRWVVVQNYYGGSSLAEYANDGSSNVFGYGYMWTLEVSSCTSLTILNGVAYVLGFDDPDSYMVSGDGNYYVEGWRLADGVRVSRWKYPHVFGTSGTAHRKPFISNDGTNLVVAFTNYSSNLVQWRKFAPSTGVQVGSTVASNLSVPKDFSAFIVTSADFGAQRYIVVPSGDTTAKVIDSAGTAQANDDFPLPTTNVTGLGWDLSNNRFCSHDPNAPKFYFHTSINWTTQSSTWWVSTTWYDPDAGGTGTHETAQGPRKSFTMKKRARLRVTPPPLPTRPVPNTTDDATASRIYVGRGSTDPGRTNMENVATTSATSYVLTSMTFPSGAAVTPPPAASNFPVSSPAKIVSDGGNFLINGDGTGTWGAVTFGAASNSKTTINSPVDMFGTLLVNVEGGTSPIVAGSYTGTGEPSVRLRRQTSDALNQNESYLYVQAGTGTAAAWQIRKNGTTMNQITLNEDYTQSTDEFRAPSFKRGGGEAYGTNYGEVTRNATASAATGAWTTVSFNTWGARFEEDGALYTSSHWRSNKAGFFVCASSVTFATAGTGYRAARIITEGGTVLSRDGFDQGTTPFRDCHTAWAGALPGGAYGIRTEVYQNSGAAINVTAHAATEPCISRFAQVA